MKSFKVKDFKRRQSFVKTDLKRQFIKAFQSNKFLETPYKSAATKILLKLHSHSISKIKSRCHFTLKPRSVYRKFYTSRQLFREMIALNKFVNIKKSSW